MATKINFFQKLLLKIKTKTYRNAKNRELLYREYQPIFIAEVTEKAEDKLKLCRQNIEETAKFNSMSDQQAIEIIADKKAEKKYQKLRMQYRALREKTRQAVQKNIDNNVVGGEQKNAELEKALELSWEKSLAEIEQYKAKIKADLAKHSSTEPKQKDDVEELYSKAKAEIEANLQAKIEKFVERNNQLISHYKKISDKYEQDLEHTSHTDVVLPDETVLSVRDLCMYFGGIKAVDGLTFDVNKKEIFGIIGPNGAGKTTVFNCITQFYKPTRGEIYFNTKENQTVFLNDEKVHDVILRGIVRTFQNVEVIKEVSVLDNLLIAAHRQFTSGFVTHIFHLPLLKIEEAVIRQRALKVLEFMGILQYKDWLAYGLPYGILKKIEIARTLMNAPQLIILDEPAAGLNDTETVELSKLIQRIATDYDCAVLLIEHDMGLVMDVCDRILAISFGKPLALGNTQEIQQNKDVQAAYLGVSD